MSSRQRGMQTFHKLGKLGASRRWGRDYGDTDIREEDREVLRNVGRRFGRRGAEARFGRNIGGRGRQEENEEEEFDEEDYDEEEEEDYPRYRRGNRYQEEESEGEEEGDYFISRSGRRIPRETHERLSRAGRRAAEARWGRSRRYD